MIRKAGFILLTSVLVALVFLIFYGWRQGSLSLMPINMTFC